MINFDPSISNITGSKPLPSTPGDERAGRTSKPNFSRGELRHVEIPQQIAKEIRAEKLRTSALIFLGTILLLLGTAWFLICYVTPIRENLKWKIPNNFFPHPAFIVIGMVAGFFLTLWGWIDYGHLKIDLKAYKGDLLLGIERVPYFLLRNYKALLSRPIYLNWIAFNLYFWGALAIGIFYLIRLFSKGNLMMTVEIISLIVILTGTLILQIGTLFSVRARKGRICAYYGYEIVPTETEILIKKKANRRCLIIFFSFLTILFFAILIPWFLVRRSKGKKILPFF